MFIVAYLYNTNGMAAWCWEAAHALAEAGEKVLLVCSNDIDISAGRKVEILRFDPFQSPRETLQQKIVSEITGLSSKSNGFVGQLQRVLEARGVTPKAYFLNQSNLQDPCVNVPQYVVGWAYPTSLPGYLSKIGIFTVWKANRTLVRTIVMSFGWWRKDWRAYHAASGVLSVSKRIADDLSRRGVQVRVVPPGTSVSSRKPHAAHGEICRLLVAALDLEDARKRVRWMIEALKSVPAKSFHITLVGHATEAFQSWVCEGGFPATFTGYLNRSELCSLMADQDIFLFGSKLDDWGYVLTEAMSQGLAVVAPNIAPFDEIVGSAGCLYELTSQKDFCDKVIPMTTGDILAQRQAAWERADALFSRRAFGKNLLAAINSSQADNEQE